MNKYGTALNSEIAGFPQKSDDKIQKDGLQLCFLPNITIWNLEHKPKAKSLQ